MNFTYETQGAITYLVCELEPQEQLDGLALGMLTNNHIAGVAPVLYTEMNGQRFLKYNISAKVSANQFFSGTVSKQRALTAFKNILNALCSADEYMITPSCFSVEAEYVFLNVSSCEVALVCIPVENNKDFDSELAAFFRNILTAARFDDREDASYIASLTACVNNAETFNAYTMRDLVANLQAGAPFSAPGGLNIQSMPPASSFTNTISIEDTSLMRAKKPPIQPQPFVQQQQSPIPQRPPVVQPQVQQPIQQPNVRKTAPAGGFWQPPVNSNGSVNSMGAGVPGGVGAYPVQQPAVKEKNKQSNGPGFAIPGQPVNGNGFATPPAQNTQPQKPKKQPKQKPTPAAPDPDKKMSFLGLLAHYNKENAEIYKKQKEEGKAKKAAEKAKSKQGGAPVSGNVPPQFEAGSAKPGPGAFPQKQGGQVYNGNPAQNGILGGIPMGQPTPRPMGGLVCELMPPQPQPVPVQNSFNETTVLSPSMLGGETTVLGMNPCAPAPSLTRIKTGEKISINKPVFRIGKEKSYVDYFIADNTAISRSHLNIYTENGEYFIEDTNSTNHTYLNGALINSNIKVKITSGDMVRLANEDFTFSV